MASCLHIQECSGRLKQPSVNCIDTSRFSHLDDDDDHQYHY